MALPGTNYEHHDPRFRRMVFETTTIEQLYTGCLWAEGPAYMAAADQVVWSDIPNNRMMRWVPEVGVGPFRRPSNYVNGNTVDLQGRLVSCEHGGRRVVRLEHDGSLTVLASHYQGKRLNSPNDVVVKSDGSIWFSDPDYGINTNYEGYQAETEIGACNVYRIDPSNGDVTIVASDFERPNGLAFSPNEDKLYISDTGLSHREGGPRHIRVFDVVDGKTLQNGRVFAVIDNGMSDGFRLDEQGNVWTSAGDGVHCFAPDGTLLGKILIPEVVSNLVFGGPRNNRLFITATKSLYAVYVGVNGAKRPVVSA